MAKQCLKHTHYSWSILTILCVTNSVMLPNTHYGFVQKLCLRIYASFGVSLHSSVTEQKYIILCLCTGRMLTRCQVLLQPILATALSDVGQGGVHIWQRVCWNSDEVGWTQDHLGSDELGIESSLELYPPAVFTTVLGGKNKKFPELPRSWLAI